MVEYFAKCFGYALVQNRNDAEGLKQSLRAIIHMHLASTSTVVSPGVGF